MSRTNGAYTAKQVGCGEGQMLFGAAWIGALIVLIASSGSLWAAVVHT